MKRPFLVIAAGCLALFLVAGIVVGELIPYWGAAQPSFRSRRPSGPSFWSILQNVSAVMGIVSFLIQIVQWRRRTDRPGLRTDPVVTLRPTGSRAQPALFTGGAGPTLANMSAVMLAYHPTLSW
jgi:hypothetical protein